MNKLNLQKARALLLGLSLFSFSLFGQNKTESDLEWVLNTSSSLVIKGETNLNSFSCVLDTIHQGDTLHSIVREDKELIVFFPNEIKIAVDQLVCENSMMTKDLRKTLHADLHPYLSINFINIANRSSEEACKARFWLSLVGTKKLVTSSCIYSGKNKSPSLEGTTTISFSDFGIAAPEKFFGTVSVQDEITISFRLHFNRIP